MRALRTGVTIALALAALAAVALFVALGLRPSEGAQRFEHVSLAPAVAHVPPPADSSEWRDARLPGDWRPFGDQGPTWCRFQFSLERVPDTPLQLFAASAGFGAEMFLNGRSIATSGRPPDAVFGRREPVWVSLPNALLVAGTNEVVLRVSVRPDYSGNLTRLWVGTPEQLRFRAYLIGILLTLPNALALIALTLAATQWLFYRTEREVEWLWLAACFALFGICGWRWRAIEVWLWPWALVAGSACVVAALHRTVGIDRRRFEGATFAGLVALFAANVFAPPDWRFALVVSSALAGIGLIGYQTHFYGRANAAPWLVRPRWFQAAALLGFALVSNDVPVYWNRAPLLGVSLVPIVHGPVLVASVVHIVIFLREQLARTRALVLDLEESQARVVALERESAARSERLRMQRELHDGVGAQLVAALAVSERAPHPETSLPETLRLALDELRLAVDSLDGGEHELGVVLGGLRARLESLLRGSELAFRWRVEDASEPPRLLPAHAVHLLRILQEAIANAVKHANARSLEVRSGEATRAGRSAPFVEVRDDGLGIRGAGAGRGLENMRQRARQIGGELEIESSAAGTSVRLWLGAGG